MASSEREGRRVRKMTTKLQDSKRQEAQHTARTRKQEECDLAEAGELPDGKLWKRRKLLWRPGQKVPSSSVGVAVNGSGSDKESAGGGAAMAADSSASDNMLRVKLDAQHDALVCEANRQLCAQPAAVVCKTPPRNLHEMRG